MKSIVGKVVSTKMVNTIVVEVERKIVHPLYKKIMKRSSKFKVHCEDKAIKVGDIVKIISVKPISKMKHFKFVEKI